MGSYDESCRAPLVSYNHLGCSGLRVSNICLGTSTFGGQQHYSHLTGMTGRPASDESTAYALLDRFTQLGGNFIDTANVYSNGQAEEIVGNWLTGRTRDDVVLTTKASLSCDRINPNSVGWSRKNLIRSLDESLRRLQTHYVDIFMMHTFDWETPVEVALRTLSDLVKSKKVHCIGVSNFTGWQLQKFLDCSKYMGLERAVVVQNEYSLLSRGVDLEVADVCQRENIGLTPWCPLKGGWLTGKMKRGSAAPSDSRIGWASDWGKSHSTAPTMDSYRENNRVWDVLDKVEEIAQKHEKTMAQVSLRWLLEKDFVPSVLVGSRTVAQLEDNIGAASGWSLTAEEICELDKVSSECPPDMYGMVTKALKRR